MADLSGRQLLREWERLAGAVPHQLVDPMKRQLELIEEIIERERQMQKDVTTKLFAPLDGLFDLLTESGKTMRLQAEAMRAAGQAIEETAALMAAQAELFERAVGALRQPTELAKAAAGVERRPRKGGRRKPKSRG